jgi:hypothetical protein
MENIKFIENSDKTYLELKKKVLNVFALSNEVGIEEENGYLIFGLKNSFFSCLITNTLNSKDGKSLTDLILFVDDLTKEGIETFVVVDEINKVFNLVFSKYVGEDEEDLIDNDVAIFKELNLSFASLTERFMSCYYNNKFVIQNIPKVNILSLLHGDKEDFVQEYYKDYLS